MYRWSWDADLQITVSQVLHGVTINLDAFSAEWFLKQQTWVRNQVQGRIMNIVVWWEKEIGQCLEHKSFFPQSIWILFLEIIHLEFYCLHMEQSWHSYEIPMHQLTRGRKEADNMIFIKWIKRTQLPKNRNLCYSKKGVKMSSSTSFAALLLHGHLHSPSPPSKARPFLAPPSNPSRPSASASARPSPARPPLLAAAAASGGERDNRVRELRVPDSWLTPEGAVQVRSKFPSFLWFPPPIPAAASWWSL